MLSSGEHSFEELVEHILALPQKYSQKVVAIDGPGGAGKSTFTKMLAGILEKVFVVHTDNFFKLPDDWQTDDTMSMVSPDVDWDRCDTLFFDRLKSGEAISFDSYSWETNTYSDYKEIPQDAIIIMDGPYATQDRFRNEYDLTIWVGAPEEVRMKRIVARDGEWRLPHWKLWNEREKRYMAAQEPQKHVDLCVDGTMTDVEGMKFVICSL